MRVRVFYLALLESYWVWILGALSHAEVDANVQSIGLMWRYERSS